MSKNQAYVDSLKRQFEHIPTEYGAEVAAALYTEFVYVTAIDSGQAALHWQIRWGSITEIQAQIIWGWGDNPPSGLAGYKWSGGANESLRTELTTYYINFADSFGPNSVDRPETFVVYNPIEPGAFTNFAPGNDDRYYYNALGDADIQEGRILSAAVDTATSSMLAKYSFLKRA